MILGRWRSLAVAGAALVMLTAVAGRLRAQGATITGRVTSQVTGAPVPDARILIIGTAIAGTTADDGRFTLRNVPAGAAQLQVLRVGYQSQKRSVTVTPGGTATSDFTMIEAVAQLDEIVTTATGQQRKVETRATQSRRSATSRKNVENAAGDVRFRISSSRRSPGVSGVAERGGRRRADDSYSRYLVDHAEQRADLDRRRRSLLDRQHELRRRVHDNSLLNNLSPEEIEDIEIVKGPSAATLYGTNAANGVVVVTTKKGRAGSTKWNLHGGERARSTTATLPDAVRELRPQDRHDDRRSAASSPVM